MDLTRRDFLLGGGAAFGGIVATSALPAFADNPALFPQREALENFRPAVCSAFAQARGEGPLHEGGERRLLREVRSRAQELPRQAGQGRRDHARRAKGHRPLNEATARASTVRSRSSVDG